MDVLIQRLLDSKDGLGGDASDSGVSVTTFFYRVFDISAAQGRGVNKGKSRVVGDDSDSFMERSAIPTRRDNRYRIDNFLGDVEANTTGQPNSGRRRFKIDISGDLSRFLGRLRRGRTYNDEDRLVDQRQEGGLRGRFTNVTNAFDYIRSRASRSRGDDDPSGQEDSGAHGSYMMRALNSASRVSATVYAAYGAPRVAARGGEPGRRPGGDTVPLDTDVDSDSLSSEESLRHPIVEALCYYNCAPLFGRRDDDARHAQRRAEPTSPAEGANAAATSGGTVSPPVRTQAGSTEQTGSTSTPRHTYPPSA
ncbi:hypothetical protein CONPUDRAFT_146916 [Coniophora puteana RWD-64-598 SS2]|uniref:Uncharacterized protein n=1 Tax=Coniophora puteana (strain RWD-64-598) TaxID=741705 RepID=A0A5M3MAG8_CONPW|nr:uncharacterized protein CONPUDRAFT_146916 [Coniophora puteana RWD-64-598 SS2]EIW75780.1 hypothetical protein CONPUDRAFT_146916 [Coniophora puteana RWD-64-598 SS2]